LSDIRLRADLAAANVVNSEFCGRRAIAAQRFQFIRT
jgi:hypothetical protein